MASSLEKELALNTLPRSPAATAAPLDPRLTSLATAHMADLKDVDGTIIKAYDLDSDLESGAATPGRYSSSPPCTSRVCDAHLAAGPDTQDCSVWPSKTMLLRRNREMKVARGCGPWRRLTSKQKVWAKILIAVLVVGAAVAVGIGISKAVGGGVWQGNGQTKPIGST